VLGGYHTGVEQGWWPGPDSCTGQPIAGLSPADLLAQIMAAPIVRCDDIAWSLLGLSMASWNMLASAGLAAVWVLAARRT
jgi:disulfide bond formation protein DsbB